MGFLFTPIGFLPNTPVKSADMNANFTAIQNAGSFWGEWINLYTGTPPSFTIPVINAPVNLTLEDYTTQDPQFAPNGLQFVRLRPSFDQSLYSSLGMVTSAVAGNNGNIYDAVYMQIAAWTYTRYTLKHGNGKSYGSSVQFSATGSGTFNHGDPVTPNRAKLNYGFTTHVGSAQNIGYSSLGSTTVVIAVSASVIAWTGHVFNA